MKCKVITADKRSLEDRLNDWLSTGKYNISNISQTQDDIYITVTIFYLDIQEERKKKLQKINKNDTN